MLMIFERYAKVASGSLYVMFLARHLGASLYGEYSESLAFIGVFGVLALAGIDSLFQKELSQTKNHSLIIKKFFLAKCVPVMLALLGYFLIWPQEDTLFIYFIPFLISVILSFPYQGLVYEEKFKQILKVSFTVIIISNICRIYLFTHQVQLYWYVLSYSLECASYPVGYFLLYCRNKNIIREKVSFNDFLMLFKNGWALIISTILVGLYTRFAILNLSSGSLIHEVGRFSLLTRIIDAMLVVAVSSSMLGMKKLLHANAEYDKHRRDYLLAMYIISFVMTILTFLCVYYVSPHVFGLQYIYDVRVAAITALVVLFSFMGIYNGRLLVIEGYYYFPLARNVLAMIAFIVFIYFTRNSYSLEKAMLSIMIAWCSSSFIFMIFTKQTRRMIFLELKK